MLTDTEKGFKHFDLVRWTDKKYWTQMEAALGKAYPAVIIELYSDGPYLAVVNYLGASQPLNPNKVEKIGHLGEEV